MAANTSSAETHNAVPSQGVERKVAMKLAGKEQQCTPNVCNTMSEVLGTGRKKIEAKELLVTWPVAPKDVETCKLCSAISSCALLSVQRNNGAETRAYRDV